MKCQDLESNRIGSDTLRVTLDYIVSEHGKELIITMFVKRKVKIFANIRRTSNYKIFLDIDRKYINIYASNLLTYYIHLN
jgi:hypothetical protein